MVFQWRSNGIRIRSNDVRRLRIEGLVKRFALRSCCVPHSVAVNRLLAIERCQSNIVYCPLRSSRTIFTSIYCPWRSSRIIFTSIYCPWWSSRIIFTSIYCPRRSSRIIFTSVYYPLQSSRTIIHLIYCPLRPSRTKKCLVYCPRRPSRTIIKIFWEKLLSLCLISS